MDGWKTATVAEFDDSHRNVDRALGLLENMEQTVSSLVDNVSVNNNGSRATMY